MKKFLLKKIYLIDFGTITIRARKRSTIDPGSFIFKSYEQQWHFVSNFMYFTEETFFYDLYIERTKYVHLTFNESYIFYVVPCR